MSYLDSYGTADDTDDMMAKMFANLIRGGLVSRRDLVEQGFTEIATQCMTADRDASWRRNAKPAQRRRRDEAVLIERGVDLDDSAVANAADGTLPATAVRRVE
jgi:hypothetical protein